MSVNLSELVRAVTSITKGENDYILISKEELDSSIKELKSQLTEARLVKMESVPETPIQTKPEQPKEQKTEDKPVTEYKTVKYGSRDPNDIVGDIEMSNVPIYYVPVGDGLYRATADRRIFLFHACVALYKAHLTEEDVRYGDQFKFLVENGFEAYDICLATKMKIADAERMLNKNNDDVPYYVRTRWNMCFGRHCGWHPVHIKEQKKEEQESAIQTAKNIKTLKQAFEAEDKLKLIKEKQEPVEEKPTDVAKSLVGTKYYIKTIISEDESPVDFNDYPNFLNVCVRKEGARGCGTSYPNLDAISNWLKEDTVVSKDFPLKDLKSFTAWCADYQISARQFLAMFDRQYNAQLAFTNDLVNAINTRLGVELLMATAKRNPRPKKEKTGSPKTSTAEVPEHVAKIKYVLWRERKYGITTLRRLFSILESVASRQQVIDLFHIQENELSYPAELDKNTAIEINKFCGKSVAIGSR